jgi:hypothetical protein
MSTQNCHYDPYFVITIVSLSVRETEVCKLCVNSSKTMLCLKLSYLSYCVFMSVSIYTLEHVVGDAVTIYTVDLIM